MQAKDITHMSNKNMLSFPVILFTQTFFSAYTDYFSFILRAHAFCLLDMDIYCELQLFLALMTLNETKKYKIIVYI